MSVTTRDAPRSITINVLSTIWSALCRTMNTMIENGYYAHQLNTLAARSDAELEAAGTTRQQELARIVHVVA